MSRVIIYTTPTCRYCTLAKEYMRQKGVDYEEIDVGSDKEAARTLVNRTGQFGVPQIEINGNMIIGFDKTAIDRELEQDE